MEKNFFIAILLATLIIIVYASPQYQKRFGNKFQRKTGIEQKESVSPKPTEISRRGKVDLSVRGRIPAKKIDTFREEVIKESIQINAPVAEETFNLENEDLRIVFSTMGGVIIEAILKKFIGQDNENPVQLVKEGESWCDGSIRDGDIEILLTELVFSIKSISRYTAVLEAVLVDGRVVRKEYTLKPEGYMLSLRTDLSGVWNNPLLRTTWHGPINETEVPYKQLRIWPFSMFMRDERNAFKKIVYIAQGERKTIETNGKEKTKRIYSNEGGQKLEARKRGEGTDSFIGDINWYAVRSKYFMTAAIPEEKMRWSAYSTFSSTGTERWFDFTLSKYLSEGATNINIYIGPISYDILKGYGNDLTESMELSFRFIRPISILFLWLFKKINTVISNWGLVIIVFAILIKIVLYPLSHKSFSSMKKMSALQPQITELKGKFKNNQQMLHKATMELYKKEGINPFSGCLPTLLQMPVFFALYPVVGRAFELRQAMFIPYWIQDLSRPDPYYILPVAMGISMFFQSKTTMKDPNQKAMLYIMPVMMVILFANFSSGLTLYWFLFNIMSYVQQKIHR